MEALDIADACTAVPTFGTGAASNDSSGQYAPGSTPALEPQQAASQRRGAGNRPWIDGSIIELPRSEPGGPASSPVRESRHLRSRVVISLDVVEPNAPIVHDETAWRSPGVLQTNDRPDSRLVVSRWRGAAGEEHSSPGIASNCHMVAIAIQPCEFTLWLGPKVFSDHDVVPGMLQITPPGVPARVVYSQPYDVLHLFVPDQLLAECFA